MPLKKVERISRSDLKLFNEFLTQNEENSQKFAEFIYISDEENSDEELNYDSKSYESIDSKDCNQVIDETNEKKTVYYIQESGEYVFPPLIRGLETIDEEDEDMINSTSDKSCSAGDDSSGN